MTVDVTTPWGKTLPSPFLECAEMAMFLRITFAAWHELPLQFEAVSGGQRVYFGHYGVRTTAGAVRAVARVRDSRTAITARATGARSGRAMRRCGPASCTAASDEQLQLGPNQVFGAYVDELHVNKRAAYFTVLTLNYLSSANLADTANTYNLVPDAIRAGDVLLERWQRNGIGHTLVVHDVRELGEGNLDVTMISGRCRAARACASRGSLEELLQSAYAGGPGTTSSGEPYAKLGGGLKRFRVTKNVGGYWTNTWMSGDEAHWINSTDYPRMPRGSRGSESARQVSPLQQRTELLSIIDDARHHLSQYRRRAPPASAASTRSASSTISASASSG